METEGLSAICTSLGIVEEDEYGNIIGYTKGDYCLDNLKDLLRFLRRDDPQSREVFQQVCKWKIASKDLVPIIRYCQSERNLVLNAVKVLVFLTMPIEATSCDVIQQTEYLWGLKSAVTNGDVIGIIVSLLEEPLENLQQETLTDDDWKLVQLVMTFFRNILAIQDISKVQKFGESAFQFLSLRDKFLELLFDENVIDVIVIVVENIGGSRCYFRHDNLLMLEIVYYIVMGQDSKLIATAGFHSKVEEDTPSSLDKLKSIMEEEQEKRRLFRKHNLNRHSNFSGTFSRRTLDGVKTLCQGNPSNSSRNVLLKRHKAPKGIKKIVRDAGGIPFTKGNILRLLHDFLDQFLSGCYNVLVRSVRDDIEKEAQSIESNDIIVFFHVAHFFTSFHYHKILLSKTSFKEDNSTEKGNSNGEKTFFSGDICGPIAATLNTLMFEFVHTKWRYAFDGLKETRDYRFLSAAGSLMNIMIRMLDLVMKLLPEDYEEAHTARSLLYQLFYDQTDQGLTHFVVNSIRAFDTFKQPKSYLADLVETIHVMLRLIETLQSCGALKVSRKARNVRKRSESNTKEEQKADKIDDTTQTKPQVNACNEEATDVPVLLPNQQHEKTSFSNHSDEPANDLPNEGQDGGTENDIDDDMCSVSEEVSDDEQPSTTHEVDFKTSFVASSFASQSVVKNLCWLLAFYKTNPLNINHYIMSLLKRITDDLGLSPMLYQLSLLTTLYDILDEQSTSPSKEYAEIVDFIKTFVRKMMRRIKKRPILFVELLFWKSRKECHCINADHLLNELRPMKKETTSKYAPADCENNRKWAPRSIADALGDDEADVVIPHYQPEQMGEDSVDLPEEAPRRKRRVVLTEELGARIKELYEKHKDSENCCREIAECMSMDFDLTPKQVLNKLRQLRLPLPRKKTKRRSEVPTIDEDDLLAKHKHSTAIEPNVLDESDENAALQLLSKNTNGGSSDSEPIIQSLYEQSKDYSVTAAQVSRKLKKFGLKVSKKPAMSDKNGRTHITAKDHSDDETLLFFKKSKNLQIQKDADSDDETIGSLVNKNSLRQKDEDTNNETLGAILKKRVRKEEARGEPQDDNIGSLLKISPKVAKLKKLKLRNSTNEERPPGNSHPNGDGEEVAGRYDDEDRHLVDELVDSDDHADSPSCSRRRRLIFDHDDDTL